MDKKETAKDKKVNGLIKLLNSSDEDETLKAIADLKIHGNQTAIHPLVKLLAKTESRLVKAAIVDLLNTVKSTKVPAEIAKCLQEPAFKNVRQELLASVWNTGLDYNQYMIEIAQATVEGGLMEAVECITIIENLENGLNEDQIMDGILIFKSYLVGEKDKSTPKNEIIIEIVDMLQQMNDTV